MKVCVAVPSNFNLSLVKEVKFSVSDIGRLEDITQQRVSQVMSLLWLSPVLQERILTFPRQMAPNKFITTEKAIRIAKEMDFEKQEFLFDQQYN